MYADLRNVSPNTAVPWPAGTMPKRHAEVPSANWGARPLLEIIGMTSSDMLTLMLGVENVKSKVDVLVANEQGTYVAPACESYWAPTAWKVPSAIAFGR
jgi:hypothetical protein